MKGDPVDDLVEAAGLLADARNSAALRVARWLTDFVSAPSGLRFEDVVGLGEKWRVQRRASLTRRIVADALSHGEAAGRDRPTASDLARARDLHRSWCRYEGSSWPRDRRAGIRPAGAAGFAFDLLAATGRIPCVSLIREVARDRRSSLATAQANIEPPRIGAPTDAS